MSPKDTSKAPTVRRKLGELFGDEKLICWVETAEDLAAPLGEDAWSRLPSFGRTAEGGSLQLFDQVFDARGEVEASAVYLGTDVEVDAFCDGLPVVLRRGANAGVLDVGASFGLSTHVPVVQGGGIQLSASAGLSGRFRYRHYLADRPARRKLAALKDLVAGSRLPNLLDLEEGPALGEVHRLDAELGLDLGLDFKAGYDGAKTITRKLADGLSLDVQTSVEATVRASLGLSLSGEMTVAVGRAESSDGEEPWIRIRVQRRSERKLSFATTFALDLDYDLGTSLVQLFEQAIGDVPIPKLVGAAAEVNELLRRGDWQAVTERLTDRSAEVLEDLFDDVVNEVFEDLAGDRTGGDWRTWLENDPRVQRLTSFLGDVVETYDRLDARVQSLWDRLLSKADLDPQSAQGAALRTLLGELADLADGKVTLMDLLEGNAARWVRAVEMLSGQSLEDLVLRGDLDEALQDAGRVARQTLELLEGTPGRTVDKIQTFAKKTGIESTVDALRKVESVEAIQTSVSTRIRRLAERLVGKASSKLTQDDLAKIQGWAEKVHRYLPAPDVDGTLASELKRRITGLLEKLRLDVGFSVSFELERISRSTALVDLELDPSSSKAARRLRRRVGESLRAGRAREIFEVLADEAGLVDRGKSKPEVGEAPASHFRIRESVFTSERIRTTATSTVLNLVGLGRLLAGKERGYTRRLQESTLRVVDRRLADPDVAAGDPQRFERHGRWAGGFQRGDRTVDLSTEAAVWLVCEDRGHGLDLDAPLEAEGVERFVRLGFSWEDAFATEQEIDALARLVDQLGFSPLGRDVLDRSDAHDVLVLGRSIRLALDLRFPESAVSAFFDALTGDDAEALWNRAYLAAAERWFAEDFVTRDRVPVAAQSTLDLGEIMVQVLRTRAFREHWASVGGFFADLGGKSIEIHDQRGKTLKVPVGRQNHPEILTGPLWMVVARHQRGARRLAEVADLWRKALADRTPESYEAVTWAFAEAWRRVSLYTLRWPSSMFAPWLWLAVLAAAAPDALRDVRGFASLRWRPGTGDQDTEGLEESGDDWEGPALWTLDRLPDLFGNGTFKRLD